MEEIKQKLNSENVFLQSQAIALLEELIKAKGKDENVLSKSAEVKMLWELVSESNTAISTLAIETLVGLAAEGFFNQFKMMQNFISCVATANACSSPIPLIRGVTVLLILLYDEETSTCPFLGPPDKPVHPYVSLITRRPEVTPAIIEEIHYLIHHPNPSIQAGWLSILKPLLYHCFCLADSSIQATKPVLDELITFHSTLGPPLIEILCKLATLTKTNSKSHLERKLLILGGLAEVSLKIKDETLITALLPCLIISLPHAIKHGLPTRIIEMQIKSIAERSTRGCDRAIFALSEILPYIAGHLQVNLLRVGALLLSRKDGNPMLASRLLPPLLQIMSFSSKSLSELNQVASSVVSLIQETPPDVFSNEQLTGNGYWDALFLSFPDLLLFSPVMEISNCVHSDVEYGAKWLMEMKSGSHPLSHFQYTTTTSLFLYQGSSSVTVEAACQVLEREVRKNRNLAPELFTMVLYRLQKEPAPETKLALLYFLPSLAINELSVAMILKTFTALWSSATLKPLILRLMLDVWRSEPRVYNHLLDLIKEKSILTDEFKIARAYVISAICEEEPYLHGKELLPLLSGILNESKADEEATQMVMALNGIYHLCAEEVIDLRTTWKVISPKLIRDPRPQITVQLCKLLSLASKNGIDEDFQGSVSAFLWNLVCSANASGVIKSAYNALEKVNVAYFKLKFLPAYAQVELKLSKGKNSEYPEDFIPGKAWVHLVTRCPQDHLPFVKLFLKALVEREVTNLPNGIYMTAVQEAKRRGFKGEDGDPPEPPNYSFLPENSTLKAFVTFLQIFPKHLMEKSAADSDGLFSGMIIILSCLSQAFCRPLPPLNWSFLNEVLKACEEKESEINSEQLTPAVKHGIFKVLAQQSDKSPSAFNQIAKWLLPSAILSQEDQLIMVQSLDQLGRNHKCLNLEECLNFVLTNALQDKDHLQSLLEAIRPQIKCDYITDANRFAISNAIENLDRLINPGDQLLYSTYKDCVVSLPLEHIERLTSHFLWDDVTFPKLRRAAILRCYVASHHPKLNGLLWLNELIDSVASITDDRSSILLEIAQTLMVRDEDATWLLTFLGHFQDHLLQDGEESQEYTDEQKQKAEFYMDIVVLALIIWSGIGPTFPLSKLCFSSEVRNALVCSACILLYKRPDWNQNIQQLLNWFISHFLRLESTIGNNYELKTIILVLASSTTSQNVWNHVIDLLS